MSNPTLDIHHGDNLPLLQTWPDARFELIYMDPPFNTGHAQRRSVTKAIQDENASRVGFGGRRYRTATIGTHSFDDLFDDYLAFLEPRIVESRRLLTETGAFFLHLDYREAHYAKVLCDAIFGRNAFMNEIIWAYDYGGRTRKRWSPKHDTILWYARDPKQYTYRYDDIDRIPYMAPRLVTPEKAERGKTPTDTWWHTIVSPTGHERTGYPTQKPRGIIDRIVRVHSNPGERILDPFAGSGTTGESAVTLGRNATLIDASQDAIDVMSARLAEWRPALHPQTATADAPSSSG